MILKIPGMLKAEQAAELRASLMSAPWVDGEITAGTQSTLAKHNLQAPEHDPLVQALGRAVLDALRIHPTFVAAALPLRVFPPLFNRYDQGMEFGAHVDNAIRFSGTARYRTDLSATLFLNAPDEYDGGELLIREGEEERAVKLFAGDLVLYPATTLHRVAPIKRGARWACVFWVQSMIRGAEQRDLLFALDQSIQALGQRLGADDQEVIALTGTYHNLIRMWSEV